MASEMSINKIHIAGPDASAVPRHSWRLASYYLLLILIAAVMAGPFLWMLFSSFKPNADLFRYPPVWLPQRITFEHYLQAFRAAPFGRYFLNSAVLAISGVAVNLLVCSMAGYAFAKFRFYRRELLFYLLLATMMVPFHVILIPLFLVAKMFPLVGGNNIVGLGGTGLLNTYPGLLIPHLAPAFGVFFMRQFYFAIPDDLLDAARIDGASEWQIFYRVVQPLAKPPLATLAIFSATGIWDDFLWPLVVTSGENMRTVQLGLQVFQSQFTVDWGPLMAATVAVTVPVLILFILCQRYFVQSIATVGLK